MPHPPHNQSLEGCYSSILCQFKAMYSLGVFPFASNNIIWMVQETNLAHLKIKVSLNSILVRRDAMQRKEQHPNFTLNLTVHFHTLSVFNWDEKTLCIHVQVLFPPWQKQHHTKINHGCR